MRRDAGAAARSPDVSLCARPPTAIVVGTRLAEGRASPSLRFLLGRALELARPEYALAAALDPDAFDRAIGPLLHDGSDAEGLRRELPFKVARRLGELLASVATDGAAIARHRSGARHTGNRAGLLLCGDLVAATSVLRAEGDEAAVEELARWAVSDECLHLAARLAHAPVAS